VLVAVGLHRRRDHRVKQGVGRTLERIRWVRQRLRSPGDSQLTGVSCPSAADCTAVGYTSPGPGSRTFSEHWTKGGWVLQRTRNPAFVTFLYAVSCSSPDACTATGYDETGMTWPVKTLAERWNGRRWAIQSTPNPAVYAEELAGVSCSSLTDCTAIGNDFDPRRGQFALAEHWNGKRWREQATPHLKGRGRGDDFEAVDRERERVRVPRASR
jgi:hypothetical protein